MKRQLTNPAELCQALEVPFSAEQLDAITAPLEPGVIIAGAGTGKTTVMAARVVWLVGTGQLQPQEVLGLTFTRKAAAELGNRIAAALSKADLLASAAAEGSEQVLTYDAFAAGLVTEFGARIGLERPPVMLTGASRFRLAAKVVAQAAGPFQAITRLSPGAIAERVLTLDAQLQSNLVTPNQVVEFSALAAARFEAAPLYRGKPLKDVQAAQQALAERLELLQLVSQYQTLKAELGLVEYADQLCRAVELATTMPAVGAELRARFKVVLLDEYQDTSTAQARLLHALFSGPTAATGRGFPVTAVGDPHQAIYGWRGAAASNILSFAELFPNATGQPAASYSLRINRRSGEQILQVGNRLAEPLAGLPGAGKISLKSAEQAPQGRVEAHRFDTQAAELDWLAETILEQHRQGTPWAEIAVLVRRNTTLAALYQVLRERDIPAEVVGLGGLLQLPEIAVVVSMLRVLADVAANPDVVALLSGPRWAIGLADLAALGKRAKELAGTASYSEPRTDAGLSQQLVKAASGTDPGDQLSLLDAVADPGDAKLSPAGKQRVAEFAAELSQLRRHASEPVADLVRRVISKLGLEVESQLSWARDSSQLGRFVAAITEYVDIDGSGNLVGLLAWLAAEQDHGVGLEQATPSQTDSVKLLTVHRAKGLEWHTVFLPCLTDKVFPGENRSGIWPTRAESLPSPLRGDAAGIAQLGEYSKAGLAQLKLDTGQEHRRSEDRLGYVAATRAKRLLIASTHLWAPGLKQQRADSPYFTAIAATAANQSDLTEFSESNPHPLDQRTAAWPIAPEPQQQANLAAAAQLVTTAAELLTTSSSSQEVANWQWAGTTADIGDAELIREWDQATDLLIEQQQRRQAREVVLPEGLSATALLALAKSPQDFATALLRPMPRPAPKAARIGSQFHEWVQRRFSLPGSFDELVGAGQPTSAEVRELITAFEAGQFANRIPLGVEVPFLLNWAGQILRGRIDAVYQWEGEEIDYLLVDWKTSATPADRLQLAVYKQAWAEAKKIPPSRVQTAFYYVKSDRLEVIDAPARLIEQAFAAVKDQA